MILLIRAEPPDRQSATGVIRNQTSSFCL